jgi:hypothetical protein
MELQFLAWRVADLARITFDVERAALVDGGQGGAPQKEKSKESDSFHSGHHREARSW